MQSKQNYNYLRTFRRRQGLHQDDVAALLGNVTSTAVSRHETGARIPTLETALAYEAIFGAPVRELFADQFQDVEAAVRSHARELTSYLEQLEASPELSRRLEAINALVQSPEPIYIPVCDEQTNGES